MKKTETKKKENQMTNKAKIFVPVINHVSEFLLVMRNGHRLYLR